MIWRDQQRSNRRPMPLRHENRDTGGRERPNSIQQHRNSERSGKLRENNQ